MIKPLYLSQARLDRSKPASALVKLLDPYGSDRALDAHHRLVWTLFADDPQRKRDFLWRNDDSQFLILSERQPNDQHDLFDLRTKLFEPMLSQGDRLGFRLRVNAVVTRTHENDGKKRKMRHDIVMDWMHGRQCDNTLPARAEQRASAAREAAGAWLERQGTTHGFDIETLEEVEYRTARLPRSGGKKDGRLGLVDVDGILRVNDAATLLAAVANGFGKAKAFGYGLMLLRRV